jgi:hypothetical protein
MMVITLGPDQLLGVTGGDSVPSAFTRGVLRATFGQGSKLNMIGRSKYAAVPGMPGWHRVVGAFEVPARGMIARFGALVNPTGKDAMIGASVRKLF